MDSIKPPSIKLPLQRDELPDGEELKDLVLSISQQATCLLENIDYLKSELMILRRFQYGQSSERKKKV